MVRRLALLLVLSLAGGVQALETPGPGTLIDPGIRPLPTCFFVRAVAFRTDLVGYVIDDCGQIFKTVDGGLSWAADEETQLAVYGVRQRRDDLEDRELGAARYMHWWSPRDGLLGVVRGAMFVTSDGGDTWKRVPTTLTVHFEAVAIVGDSLFVCDQDRRILRGDLRGLSWVEVRSPFDRKVDWCAGLETGPEGSVTARSGAGTSWSTVDGGLTWTRLPGVREKSWAKDPGCPGARAGEVVRCGIRELVFERSGQPPRRVPIASKPSGRKVPLLGAARGQYDWIGWTDGQLVRSRDGVDWTVEGDLPARPARMTVFPTDALILEADDGRVFRGRPSGSFRPSSAPTFDRADVEHLRTGKPGPSPFACMATARVARLEFQMASDGCFHHVEPHPVFTLELGPKGAALTVVYGEATYDRRLDRAEALALVDGVAAAIAPLERPNHFSCTSSYKMAVSSSCDGVAGEPLEFTDDGCQEAQVNGGYSRALALRQVTAEAAKGAR